MFPYIPCWTGAVLWTRRTCFITVAFTITTPGWAHATVGHTVGTVLATAGCTVVSIAVMITMKQKRKILWYN